MPDPKATGAPAVDPKAASAVDPKAAPAADPNAAPAGDAGNLLDDAAKEAKTAQDAENKRLLEAKDEDLNDEDKLKKAELIKAGDAQGKAKGAPEKYEFKAPEGMTLDQALVDKFIPIAKKLGLSQEGAQELVNMYAEAVKVNDTAQAENFKTFVEGLKAETIKELGANYKEQLAFAAKSRDRFCSPELVDKLNQSGLANDKDMVKLLITIGKAVSEDKPPEGRGAVGGPKSPESVLFPTANPK